MLFVQAVLLSALALALLAADFAGPQTPAPDARSFAGLYRSAGGQFLIVRPTGPSELQITDGRTGEVRSLSSRSGTSLTHGPARRQPKPVTGTVRFDVTADGAVAGLTQSEGNEAVTAVREPLLIREVTLENGDLSRIRVFLDTFPFFQATSYAELMTHYLHERDPPVSFETVSRVPTLGGYFEFDQSIRPTRRSGSDTRFAAGNRNFAVHVFPGLDHGPGSFRGMPWTLRRSPAAERRPSKRSHAGYGGRSAKHAAPPALPIPQVGLTRTWPAPHDPRTANREALGHPNGG